MNAFLSRALAAGSLLALLLAAGCARGPAQAPPVGAPPPPEVVVGVPVRKQIIDYEDTTGRIEAVKTVEIRARVTGYLRQVRFTEGSEVKKDDVLFEIDPRPYQAELAKAQAAVAQNDARLNRLSADYQRGLVLRTRNAIGKEEFDKITADREETEATLASARAERDLAKLRLGFCEVRAPVSGLVSRYFTDVGNLIKADETPLTVIVTQDPIYAYFDVDERTMLRLRHMIARGELPADPVAAKMPVLMGLADEDGFPHKGTINFVDNRLDNTTGTLHMRAEFSNHKRILTPGLFIRIRVPIGAAHDVILIPEEALGTDQGRKFVYVIGQDDTAESRQVKIGKLDGSLRVITDGLKAGERVVIDGLQRVRPGAKVTPVAAKEK